MNPALRLMSAAGATVIAPSVVRFAIYTGAAGGGGDPIADQLADYETWLGRSLDLVEDFEANDTWDNVAGPGWQLNPWEATGRRLIYTVPLLAGPYDRSGPTTGMLTGPVSFEAVAAGDYDTVWTTLADNLISRGLQDTIIRLGHEFNGGWYVWSCWGEEAEFIAAFQHVVTTMRAVTDQAFEFCWNPVHGYQQFPAEDAYPGDSYVDYIGVDTYDEAWGPGDTTVPDPLERWADYTYGGDHELLFWSGFADTHGKPLALPEWGVNIRPRATVPPETDEEKYIAFFADPLNNSDGHGGGDNPYFIEQMHAFITDPANNVAFTAYFEFDAVDGVHELAPVGTPFVDAAAAFLTLFGG